MFIRNSLLPLRFFCADLFELHDIIEREAQSTCNVIMFHKSLFQLVWPLVNFQSGICILGCNGHWRCPNHWQVCYDTWKQVKCHLWNNFSGIPSQPVKKIKWAIFFEHRKYKKVPGSSRFTLRIWLKILQTWPQCSKKFQGQYPPRDKAGYLAK